MNKQELLKQYPEQIKEIARDVLRAWQGPTDHLREFEDKVIDEVIKEQTKPKLEWEILSILMDDSLYRVTKVIPNKSLILETEPGSTSFDAGPDTWKYIFEERKAQIHSVKRLSDGEVFTAGNWVEYAGKRLPIKAIVLDKSFLIVRLHDGEGLAAMAGYGFEKIKKLTPLFKTKDGVEIFEKDAYYWVNKNLRINGPVIAHKNYSGSLVGTSPGCGWDFSTKAVAEAYILENKVSLTAKEVIALRRSTNSESAFVHTIEELVKSKL